MEWRIVADVWIAQERLSQVSDHLSGAGRSGKQALLEKHPDDVGYSPIFLRDASEHYEPVQLELRMWQDDSTIQIPRITCMTICVLTLLHIDRHNLRPPHSHHKRRPRRFQRHRCRRPPPRRIQSPHPTLWHRPQRRRRHLCRCRARSRRRRNRIPRRCPRCRLPRHICLQIAQPTMLQRSPSMRRHCECYQERYD